MTSNISAWAIRKPVPTIVLFVVLTLMGIASFLRLPVNANPSVSFPVVTVVITQPSAQPAEMETQIAQRVEAALTGVQGVRRVTTSISPGVSTTSVELQIGADLDRAIEDGRDAVTRIRADLPADITEKVDRGGGFGTAWIVHEVLGCTRKVHWPPDTREAWNGFRTARPG